MPKQTKLDKCVKCKKQQATVGVSRSFYVLQRAGHSSGRQAKGSLPAVGYCPQCLLIQTIKEGGAEEPALNLLRSVSSNAGGGRSVPLTSKRKSGKIKPGTRAEQKVTCATLGHTRAANDDECR